MGRAVLVDRGALVTGRWEAIAAYEEATGLASGSVRTLLFGGPDDEDHVRARLERGELGWGDYLAGVAAAAPDVLGRPWDAAGYATHLAGRGIAIAWPVVAALRDVRARGVVVVACSSEVREFAAATAGLVDPPPWDDVVSSFEAGVRKPARELYERAAAVAGVPLDRCLAVEDDEVAAGAARALGCAAVAVGGDPGRAAEAVLRWEATTRG